MRKRISWLLALAALVVGLAAPPAEAAYAGGIVSCSGNNSTACWDVVGVAATIKVDNYTMGCNGGNRQSVYVAPGGSNQKFIEFAIGQDRGPLPFCEHTDYIMSVISSYGGVQDVLFTRNLTTEGDYRLLIKSIASIGFTFEYDDPSGVRHNLLNEAGVYYSPPDWYKGYGLTSMELVKTTDQPGPYHKNVWVQSSSSGYPWYPANCPSRPMTKTVLDQVGSWKAQVVRGVSGVGDRVNYSTSAISYPPC